MKEFFCKRNLGSWEVIGIFTKTTFVACRGILANGIVVKCSLWKLLIIRILYKGFSLVSSLNYLEGWHSQHCAMLNKLVWINYLFPLYHFTRMPLLPFLWRAWKSLFFLPVSKYSWKFVTLQKENICFLFSTSVCFHCCSDLNFLKTRIIFRCFQKKDDSRKKMPLDTLYDAQDFMLIGISFMVMKLKYQDLLHR